MRAQMIVCTLVAGAALALPSTALASPTVDAAIATIAAKKKKRKKKKVTKPAVEVAAAADDNRELRRGERVEFDARLIQGQTAKAGAVYLFERVTSNLRSMVRVQNSFRHKIIRPVFPKKRGSR